MLCQMTKSHLSVISLTNLPYQSKCARGVPFVNSSGWLFLWGLNDALAAHQKSHVRLGLRVCSESTSRVVLFLLAFCSDLYAGCARSLRDRNWVSIFNRRALTLVACDPDGLV